MTSHEFLVEGAADPQTLPRIIGHLGRRWITPIRVTSLVSGPLMSIRIATVDLPRETAERIAETLRAFVLVSDVTLMST